MLAAGTACLGTLVVTSPASLAGEYADAALDGLTDDYSVNGSLAITATCPCAGRLEDLSGQILLLPDSACPACSIESVLCAAERANATGVLLSCYFNVGGTPLGSRAVEKPADCGGVPAYANTARMVSLFPM